MKKRLRQCSYKQSSKRFLQPKKTFADEEAIETEGDYRGMGQLVATKKTFADEEAIETFFSTDGYRYSELSNKTFADDEAIRLLGPEAVLYTLDPTKHITTPI